MIDILINPYTKIDIETFMNSGFPCLCIIGPKGSGKSLLAEKIIDLKFGTDAFNKGSNTFTLNGASSGIQEIRELQKNLSLTTVGANKNRRAVVLKNFEQFGHEAQNALLKTLEEPPLDTFFVLTVNQHDLVLPTIFSRVARVTIRPVDLQTAIQYFGNQYDKSIIMKNLDLSMGQPGLLYGLLTNDDHPLVSSIEHAKNLLLQSRAKRLAEIDQLSKTKDPALVPGLLDAFVRIFFASYLAKCKVGNNQDTYISLQRLNLANQTRQDLSLGVNKKLALTNLFINL